MSEYQPTNNILFDITYDVQCLLSQVHDIISDMIDCYAPNLANTGLERAFVHEMIRQIFDFMTSDYVKYTAYLQTFPNFSRFIGFNDYCKSQEGLQELKGLTNSIANGFFFHLRDEGLFRLSNDDTFPFILNNPDRTYLLLQYIGSAPFKYHPN